MKKINGKGVLRDMVFHRLPSMLSTGLFQKLLVLQSK